MSENRSRIQRLLELLNKYKGELTSVDRRFEHQRIRKLIRDQEDWTIFEQFRTNAIDNNNLV